MQTISDTSRTVRICLYVLGAALTMVVAALSGVDKAANLKLNLSLVHRRGADFPGKSQILKR